MAKDEKENVEPKGKEEFTSTGTYSYILKEAKINKRAKSLMPTFVEFDKAGKEIVGKFLARNEVGATEEKRGYYQYTFETDDGIIKFHLGNVTDADAGCLMEIGCIYYIRYDGKEKLSGGRRVNKFEVVRLFTEEEARRSGLNEEIL